MPLRPTAAPDDTRTRLEDFLRAAQGVEGPEELRAGLPLDTLGARLHRMFQDSNVLFQQWTLEILFLLGHQHILRFNQLRVQLKGISTRTLSAKLAMLREKGFVSRTFHDVSPPRAEYRLTGEGERLTALARPMFVYLQLRARTP